MHDHADHSCSHDHGSSHSHSISNSKLGCAVALTLAFVIAETVCGVFSHSLALLSDAGHNFADAAALGFSWYAVWIARKPANASMTYGYHRVGILAALVNAVSLVVIAIFVLLDAIARFSHPQPTDGRMMIIVAAVAIAMNLLIGMWLHAGAQHDLNLRSAYLHMIGDAISAAGVVIAGIVVVATHWSLADPIVSLLIAALILWSSYGVLKESVSVLMEATPAGMDMACVQRCISSVPGVLNVHDLHVWTVGPGAIACSVHVLVDEQSIRSGQQILRSVVDILDQNHGIGHTTVQVEVDGHETNDIYCCIHGSEHVGHAH